MADLKLKIIPDLRKLSADISKLVKKKFNINVSGSSSGGGGNGGGTSGGGKEQKKQTKGILKTAGLIGLLVAAFRSLKPVIDIIAAVIAFIFFGILKLVKFLAQGGMAELFSKLKTKLVEWLKNLWEGFKTWIGEAWMKIVEWLKNLWQGFKDGLTEAWNNIVQWLKNLWQTFKDKIKESWQNIKDALVRGWELLKEVFNQVKEKIITWLKIGWALLEEGWGILKEWFAKIWGIIKDKFLELTSKVKELKEKFIESITSLRDKIVDKLSAMITKLKNLPQAISNAIKSALSNIKSLFTSGGSPSSGEESVGDAIITPQGKVIKTDPKDFLIATKTPGSLGGGGGGSTFNFNGMGMEEAMERVKRELAVDVNRSNKF